MCQVTSVKEREFVHKNPAHGGLVELVDFAIGAPEPSAILDLTPPGAVPEPTHKGVHRNASDTRIFIADVHRWVAGAFKEFGIAEIGSHEGLAEKKRVGVVGRGG